MRPWWARKALVFDALYWVGVGMLLALLFL